MNFGKIYALVSHMVLKTLRNKLNTVELYIIDEISMISNMTFMFINRLCEIFDTTNTDDGFFGRKHSSVWKLVTASP